MYNTNRFASCTSAPNIFFHFWPFTMLPLSAPFHSFPKFINYIFCSCRIEFSRFYWWFRCLAWISIFFRLRATQWCCYNICPERPKINGNSVVNLLFCNTLTNSNFFSPSLFTKELDSFCVPLQSAIIQTCCALYGFFCVSYSEGIT